MSAFDEDLFLKGLEQRKATLGAEYVEKNLAAADEFTRPFQEAMTAWCWGFGWGDDVIDAKTRSMMNLSMIGALGKMAEWETHCRGALNNGVTQSGAAPIAQEGLAQIQALYRIEKDLRRLGADQRLAARQKLSKPIIDAFEGWLAQNRARVSAKSPTGEALKYIAKYWDGLCRFLGDGRIELDNNPVECTIRPIALNRKNALFAGHDAGAQNWAIIASLIETCKLNRIEPHGYLSGVLTAIAGGHKQTNINKLLPWNYAIPV